MARPGDQVARSVTDADQKGLKGRPDAPPTLPPWRARRYARSWIGCATGSARASCLPAWRPRTRPAVFLDDRAGAHDPRGVPRAGFGLQPPRGAGRREAEPVLAGVHRLLDPAGHRADGGAERGHACAVGALGGRRAGPGGHRSPDPYRAPRCRVVAAVDDDVSPRPGALRDSDQRHHARSAGGDGSRQAVLGPER